MSLTRDEAIREFRKMWEWIADETEKQKRFVTKEEYFLENDLPGVAGDCYLCEYDHGNTKSTREWCSICPISFGKGSLHCLEPGSVFSAWDDLEEYEQDEWELAAEYARKIANLPEED